MDCTHLLYGCRTKTRTHYTPRTAQQIHTSPLMLRFDWSMFIPRHEQQPKTATHLLPVRSIQTRHRQTEDENVDSATPVYTHIKTDSPAQKTTAYIYLDSTIRPGPPLPAIQMGTDFASNRAAWLVAGFLGRKVIKVCACFISSSNSRARGRCTVF